MLLLAVFSVLVFVVAPWGVLNGSFFRKPFLMVMWGIFLAGVGAYFVHVLEFMGATPAVAAIFPNIELAAKIIGFTVAAAGGGLIASGVVLKVQSMAVTDKKKAKDELLSAIELEDALEDQIRKVRANEEGIDEAEVSARLDELIGISFLVRENKRKAVDNFDKQSNLV